MSRQSMAVTAVMMVTGAALADGADWVGNDPVTGTYFIDVPDGSINAFFSPAGFPRLISGHRGGFKTLFPENAIETFEETLRFAPALLEVDLRRTNDGVWILMHDSTLDRTTTGSGAVVATTWADMKDLNLVDNDGNVTPYRIPTFTEVLEWANDRAIMELDLKADAFVSEIVDIITANQAEDDVRFIADDIEQANAVYNQNSSIHLGLFFSPGTALTRLQDLAEEAAFPFGSLSAFTCCTGSVNPESFYQLLHDTGIISIWAPFGVDDGLNSEDAIALYQDEFAKGVNVIAGNRYPEAAAAAGYAPTCRADATGDGGVDVDDLVAVILDWGTDGAANNADVDGSGNVDVDDVVAVVLAWGACR